MHGVGTSVGCVLERMVVEYGRPKAQAALWVLFTERVFDKAGMAEGMNVLDAGCGPCAMRCG